MAGLRRCDLSAFLNSSRPCQLVQRMCCVCVYARAHRHTYTHMHECMHACQRTNTSSRSFTISLALARACSRAPSIARTCWLEPSQSESII